MSRDLMIEGIIARWKRLPGCLLSEDSMKRLAREALDAMAPQENRNADIPKAK